MAPKPLNSFFCFKSEVLPNSTHFFSKGTQFVCLRTSLNTSTWLDVILIRVYFVTCTKSNISDIGNTQAFLYDTKSGINTIVVLIVSHSTTLFSIQLASLDIVNGFVYLLCCIKYHQKSPSC